MRVADLTWDTVAKRIADGVPAILPIGAGAKQHGLHLPMGTDLVQAEWLAGRIAEAVDALIWPTVAFGPYPAFAAYPGSMSLSPETFRALLRDLCRGLLGHGVRSVFLLDTGISTIPPIEALIGEPDWDGRLRHIRTYDGPRTRAVEAQLRQQAYGSHADELETSIMLALVPDRVAMHRAAPSPPELRDWQGPLSPDPAAPGYSASGSFGDPRLATRAKGEALLEAMVADAVAAIRAGQT